MGHLDVLKVKTILLEYTTTVTIKVSFSSKHKCKTSTPPFVAGWRSRVWAVLLHCSSCVLPGAYLGQLGGHHHRAGGPQDLPAEAVGEMGMVDCSLHLLSIHYCGFCS